MSDPYESLRIDIEDGVATLVLNRVDRHNAINKVMNRELPDAWARLEADVAVRAIIVTGAGDRAFCTGADLADPPTPTDPAFASSLSSIAWTGRQNGGTKPVIAAVNGMAVGGGLHFIADADIVIAAEHARLIDTHVAVGLVAA
ncbi:MAG: enoyl-CoA hydratase/isomerase family protein, partial [Polymorphobacter sp.]